MQECTDARAPACRARLVFAHLCICAFAHLIGCFPVYAQASGIASLIIDLRTGATLSAEQPAIMDRPVLPGSVMKVAGLAAALEAGLIDGQTRVVCTRTVVVDGHQLTCTHPDLHRALTPAEALAHSCNVYVASVAARLPRAELDRTLVSMGLGPSAPGVSVPASVLGLEGNRVSPRDLIGALARVGSTASPIAWRPATRAVVPAGLRDGARVGTAAALGAAGIDALAKTGTVDAGGVSQGLVVGVTPSNNPTLGFAMLVSGGAGMDAAGLMASRLQPDVKGGTGTTSVRIGVTQPDGGVRVREMGLDTYVADVIAGEAAAGTSPAALDALAIAARTYALANRGRHRGEDFDLCDLTHCQVLRTATRATTSAALRTSGRYLADGAAPAQVFYTASCGGHTEKPSAVWRGAADPAFLPARRDEACEAAPGWESEITARDLLRALRAGGFVGDMVLDVSVTSRSASGRVAWLRVDGVSPSEISGENLRTLVGRTLGWQYLRSTLFDISRTSAGVRVRGHGAGHGVGLCVTGAATRARAGATAEAILRAYYPGLELRRLDDAPTAPGNTGPRIVLPQQDEASRRGLQGLVDASLAAVARRLDAVVPPAVVLRFHPTVESYQRATGRPWFTAGSTRGTEVDLLPLQVLRSRGLLDATLRHEMAHVLTADSMRGAPLWMREGVAVWAEHAVPAETPRQGAPPGGPCPADAEFTRAASADALRVVYEKAEACYERELGAGRSWRVGGGR